jgi:hypothetical protein
MALVEDYDDLAGESSDTPPFRALPAACGGLPLAWRFDSTYESTAHGLLLGRYYVEEVF